MTLQTGKKAARRLNNGIAKEAFTLIELALVAIIIISLIGLSTPLFRKTLSDLTLKNTAFNISKLINYAQEKSIVDRKNFRISFDFNSGAYQLSEMDESTDPPVYKAATGRFGKAFKTPRGVFLEGSVNEEVFYPNGQCDELVLDVVDESHDGYKITVKGFGGGFDIAEVKGGK